MADVDMRQIGPLQLLAVAFSKPVFKGKINDELQKLRDQNLIRIVDGVVVQKSEAGAVTALEESDLTAAETKQYGAVIGGLIGIGMGGAETAQEVGSQVAEKFSQRYEYGLDKEDLEDVAENIPEGDAAMILLVEHSWLTPLRNALRDADGILLAQDFLSPELLMSLGDAVATA